MLAKFAYLTLCRSIQLLVLLARGDAAKDLEILVLRHQLAVLRRQTPRPRFEPADRAVLAASSRALPRARWSCFFVRPETLLRWHRRLVAGAWTSPHRGPGRPPLDQQLQQLIVRLARENPRWATSTSRASYSGLACAPRQPRSAARCAVMGWTRRRDRRPPAGGRSCASRRPASSRATSFTVDTIRLRRLHMLFFIELAILRVPHRRCGCRLARHGPGREVSATTCPGSRPAVLREVARCQSTWPGHPAARVTPPARSCS